MAISEEERKAREAEKLKDRERDKNAIQEKERIALEQTGDPYLNPFKETPYYNDTDFQNVINNYKKFAQSYGQEQSNEVYQQVSGYTDTFKNQFKNKVGRDPNAEEYNQFFKFLGTEGPWAQNAGVVSGKIGQQVSGLISDRFSRTAEEEAQKKLETQSKEALAPSGAFDVWQNSYRNSINEVEKSLSDYQSRLFEKIRPNLITSLKTQGLLNSGALNEAFAGTAGDLAAENSNYLASARGAIEQDITNQRYALESSPTTYKLNTTMNNPAQLYAGGQQALQNVWQSTMANIEANNARNLYDYQNSNRDRPNALSQYGGLILGGVAGGLPGAFASYASSRANARDRQGY